MKNKKIITEIIGIIALFLLLFFLAWISGVRDTGRDENKWDWFSERAVWGRITQVQNNAPEKKWGFLSFSSLESYTPERDAYEEETTIDEGLYIHSVGLQGTMYAYTAKIFRLLGVNAKTIGGILWCMNAAICWGVFLLFAVWAFCEMGRLAGIAVVYSIFAVTWMNDAITNLYWVIWSFFLPTVVTAFMGRALWKQMNKNTESTRIPIEGGWLLLLLLVTLFRFLCGFEFTSTVMISAEVPIFFYFIKDFENKEKRKYWFRQMEKVGVVLLISFCAAMLVWLFMQIRYMGLEKALLEIVKTIAARTGVMKSALDENAMNVLSESLDAPRMQVVQLMVFNQWPAMGKMYILHILVLTFLLQAAKSFLIKENKANMIKFMAVYMLSLAAPLSWFYLASGHTYIHYFIDVILWMMPVIPLAMAYMGNGLEEILKLAEEKIKE